MPKGKPQIKALPFKEIPSREFVLQVLGISKEQDDKLQEKYKKHKGSNIKSK